MSMRLFFRPQRKGRKRRGRARPPPGPIHVPPSAMSAPSRAHPRVGHRSQLLCPPCQPRRQHPGPAIRGGLTLGDVSLRVGSRCEEAKPLCLLRPPSLTPGSRPRFLLSPWLPLSFLQLLQFLYLEVLFGSFQKLASTSEPRSRSEAFVLSWHSPSVRFVSRLAVLMFDVLSLIPAPFLHGTCFSHFYGCV